MGRLEEDIVGLLYALGLYRSMASFSSKNTILFLFHIFSLFLRIQSYPQHEENKKTFRRQLALHEFSKSHCPEELLWQC